MGSSESVEPWEGTSHGDRASWLIVCFTQTYEMD